MNGRPATACDRSRDSMRPATAPATVCDRTGRPRRHGSDHTKKPAQHAGLEGCAGLLTGWLLRKFSASVFRRKFSEKNPAGGVGGQISVQIFENFSVGPWGLSNRRAMISSVRRQRLLQQFQQRFNGTSITFTVGGARSCRPALSECRQTTVPVLSAFGVNASCVAVLCVSSVPVLLSHRSKCRRSARSSSSIGRNHSQHASGAIIHASGVLLAMPHIKAHPSATLQTVAHPARTQAIKIPRSL